MDPNTILLIITLFKLKKDFEVKSVVNGSITHAVIDDTYIWQVKKN